MINRLHECHLVTGSRADLEDIRDYIASDNRERAVSFV
jgi:plasmid stabilization system protein ParE